ncbi:MAG: hypothetical protein KA354_22905 [Phycisphaerae bacterium]|nr:hypothetical protein [Phycisphaerae bacterium]
MSYQAAMNRLVELAGGLCVDAAKLFEARGLRGRAFVRATRPFNHFRRRLAAMAAVAASGRGEDRDDSPIVLRRRLARLRAIESELLGALAEHREWPHNGDLHELLVCARTGIMETEERLARMTDGDA